MSFRVLIVDDAAFIREILRSQLEVLGHIVVGEAVDGQDAILQSLKQKPDLILMDLVLPKLNGVKAVEQILASQPSVKIVAMSSLDQEFLIQKALSQGCVSFISKPFDQKSIRAMLDQISGKKIEQTGAS